MIFSVIVPIYNVEKYLIECIESVLLQDFNDYEIILVNDGSTDGSAKICDNYAEKYSHIRVIHKENGGLSDARNFGIKQAKGDYLMFLDSDDFWEGTKVLSDLFEIIKKDNNPDVILHGFTRLGIDKKELHFKEKLILNNNGFENDLFFLVLKGIYHNYVWTKIIKREIIINNNLFFEKNLLYEDMPYVFDLAFHINTYSVYWSNFYQYREREGSITSRVNKEKIEHLSKSINNKLNVYLLKDDKKLLVKEGLKKLTLNDLYYSFRHFLRFSIKDVLSLYRGQKQIWEKSCKIWGKDFMIKKYFNNRKIGYLPFPIALFIVYIEQKIYKY